MSCRCSPCPRWLPHFFSCASWSADSHVNRLVGTLTLLTVDEAQTIHEAHIDGVCMQELKYCDSLDPNHEWPSSYRDADWPQRGEPAYPRMQLENRCYESRVFRRLHMELVHRQDSIQVHHLASFSIVPLADCGLRGAHAAADAVLQQLHFLPHGGRATPGQSAVRVFETSYLLPYSTGSVNPAQTTTVQCCGVCVSQQSTVS